MFLISLHFNLKVNSQDGGRCKDTDTDIFVEWQTDWETVNIQTWDMVSIDRYCLK